MPRMPYQAMFTIYDASSSLLMRGLSAHSSALNTVRPTIIFA